jgi:hypothetical protein
MVADVGKITFEHDLQGGPLLKVVVTNEPDIMRIGSQPFR